MTTSNSVDIEKSENTSQEVPARYRNAKEKCYKLRVRE